MSNPKVSVCIPSYNCASYIGEAIESVLAQTFSDFELLIIDDCSTDASCAVIEEYLKRDGRIRFLRNSRNLGMVNNWNHCLAESRGEYIHYLFADDLLASPECLARMSAILDEDPGISLAATARTIINEESVPLKVVSKFPSSLTDEGTRVIRRCLYEGRNLVGEPSVVMFRRSQAGRGFNPEYRQLVDLEMWFHLLEQGRFSYIAEPLASFREHPTQQTKVNLRQMVHIDEFLHLLEQYGGRPYVRFSGLTRWYLSYNQSFRVWKLHTQGLIDRNTAEGKIGTFRGMGSFFSLMPFYKLLTPLIRLRGALMRRY